MMVRIVGLSGLSLLLLGFGGAASADSALSMGIKAGTTGIGVEAVYGLKDKWNVRGALNGLDYGKDFEEAGIDYDGDLRLRSASLIADWHVFDGTFRISAGAFINGNELAGKADGNLDIGNDTYDARLQADIDWRRFAPYLGIGWGNSMKGGRLSFSTDLGVMFTGSPTARLTGEERTGLIDPSVFEEDLRREEADLNDEISDFKYYPVVTVGVNYRF